MIDFRIQSHVLIRKILERSSGKSGNILCDTSRRFRGSRQFRESMRWLDGDAEYQDVQSSLAFGAMDESTVHVDDDGDEDGTGGDLDDIDSPMPVQKEFMFTADRLPTAQQTVYCVSDIDIPEVREMIAMEPERDTYDPVEGWLKPGSTKRIRSLMTQYLHKWLEEN
ncbi:unnamed protein product [Echinostoma caproni]|uniref:DUF1115 domain-containing protein n=1 Tax=Echinostoma caproni TaxID=27848 RepID=A0A183B577_9TREM|nr:unnamed protein product [Echinostoma caproni]